MILFLVFLLFSIYYYFQLLFIGHFASTPVTILFLYLLDGKFKEVSDELESMLDTK